MPTTQEREVILNIIRLYIMFYMFVWASHVVVLCFEELEVAIDFTLFFNIQKNGINRSSISFQLSSSDSF